MTPALALAPKSIYLSIYLLSCKGRNGVGLLGVLQLRNLRLARKMFNSHICAKPLNHVKTRNFQPNQLRTRS